jgi:hypothetical protein
MSLTHLSSGSYPAYPLPPLKPHVTHNRAESVIGTSSDTFVVKQISHAAHG